jgi:hypothetical protein
VKIVPVVALELCYFVVVLEVLHADDAFLGVLDSLIAESSLLYGIEHI